MPNWCNNVVVIAHNDHAMLDRVCSAYMRGELLQEFIPCPQALLDTESVYYPDGDERKALHEAREEQNVAQFGYHNWYDWKVAHWGTKWDVGNEGEELVVDNGTVTMSFDSAWSPPIEAYEQLIEQGFDITAYYYEPGMAFCGMWENGSDDMYHIPNTSAEALEVIPEEIDATFDIVNSMAMWEEEDAAYDG